MVQSWVRDVTVHSNVFADNQIIHFYRYMIDYFQIYTLFNIVESLVEVGLVLMSSLYNKYHYYYNKIKKKKIMSVSFKTKHKID